MPEVRYVDALAKPDCLPSILVGWDEEIEVSPSNRPPWDKGSLDLLRSSTNTSDHEMSLEGSIIAWWKVIASPLCQAIQ
jgi:hypothetical protein